MVGSPIFEKKIRAGFSLFEPFLSSDIDFSNGRSRLGTTALGGMLSKSVRFISGEMGSQSEEDQKPAGVLLKAYKTSIRAKMRYCS